MKLKYIQLEERDDDGYWIYLKPGWKNDNDAIGVNHTIVENTKREAHAHRPIPCRCTDCEGGKAVA